MLSLDTVKKLSKEKLSILIVKDYGLNSNISDQELIDSGATIETEENILKKSDVVLKISLEESDKIELLKNGANIVLNNFYHYIKICTNARLIIYGGLTS